MVECFYEEDSGEIVIRVGKTHLAWMVQHIPSMKDDRDLPYVRVADEVSLAKDVVKELTEEQEDGTTPIHLILDAALEAALDNGSDGYAWPSSC